MADEITTSTTELGQDDILTAFDKIDVPEDDDTTEEISDKEPKLKPEVKDTEEEEDETESKETGDSDDKEIELTDSDELDYSEVPQRAAIKGKYPNIFKEFPGLDRAIYREDAYTKIFPSIKTAEEAKTRLDTFSKIEADLFNGDISNVLASVKQNDQKAFEKITATFLQTLDKVDKGSHSAVTNHVMKSALAAIAKHGKAIGKGDVDSDGGQLELAAKILNKFIYQTDEIEEPKPIEVKVDPRESEISRKEIEFNQRQLDTAVKDVSNRVSNTIKAVVEKNIDPRGLMTDYVRNKSVEDVIAAVFKEYSSDSRFRNHLDGLWKNSEKDGYSDESKGKIRAALLTKAKSVITGHIKYVRQAAMKGSNAVRKVKKVNDEDDEPVTRRQAPAKQSSSNSNSKPRVGGVSDVMEYLNRNVR